MTYLPKKTRTRSFNQINCTWYNVLNLRVFITYPLHVDYLIIYSQDTQMLFTLKCFFSNEYQKSPFSPLPFLKRILHILRFYQPHTFNTRINKMKFENNIYRVSLDSFKERFFLNFILFIASDNHKNIRQYFSLILII